MQIAIIERDLTDISAMSELLTKNGHTILQNGIKTGFDEASKAPGEIVNGELRPDVIIIESEWLAVDCARGLASELDRIRSESSLRIVGASMIGFSGEELAFYDGLATKTKMTYFSELLSAVDGQKK